MSFQAMTWAVEQDAAPLAKLLLLILANYADAENKCWPSKDRLAKDTGMSKASVCKHLNDLEAKGLVTVAERFSSERGQTSSIIALSVIRTPLSATRTAPVRETDTPLSATRTQTYQLEPVIEPRVEARKRATRIPDDWQPDMDEARKLGFTDEAARWEADKFRDYWSARAGKDAAKLDWLGTWRNWLKRSVENGRQSKPNSPTRHRNAFVDVADRLEREAILARGGDPERESVDGMLRRLREGGPGNLHGGDAGVVCDVPRSHSAGGCRSGDRPAFDIEMDADNSGSPRGSGPRDAGGTRPARPRGALPRPSRGGSDAED